MSFLNNNQASYAKLDSSSSSSSSFLGLSKLSEERLLTFCGIACAAYVGAFSRIGINYYQIWSNETNYCVMYTQVIGCLIMGYYLFHGTFENVKSYVFV